MQETTRTGHTELYFMKKSQKPAEYFEECIVLFCFDVAFKSENHSIKKTSSGSFIKNMV